MWLRIENLSVTYGMIKAINNISFELTKGEIVTLIGANGAGKTTILNTISGIVKSANGKIVFNGQEITNFPAYKIARLGIAHVPEGRKPFPNLTVYENLRLGAYNTNDKNKIEQGLNRVFKSFPRLKERLKQPAGTLSGGELQMLAMARGLMSQPELLMLDEPSMGLSPILVSEIFSIIQEINQQGTTILLVEQNANMALNTAHRAYVLETGKIVLSGKACELREDPRVKSAYLGE
ncbi:MAG: ABC transporter ATP-binding protein [candidate division WOR-3 bacterium]|nr:ABC transporter ATP-binding protein [candidate division WOR-3 bacterium]